MPLASQSKHRQDTDVTSFPRLIAICSCLLGPVGGIVIAKDAVSVNLTPFGTASASSEEAQRGNRVAHAVDGKPATRWCSTGPIPGSWFSLDLTAPCTLSQVVVHWEQNVSYQYKLEGSLDGTTWFPLTDAASVEAKGMGKHAIRKRTRHVRIAHLNPSITAWSSIRELQVWGVPE